MSANSKTDSHTDRLSDYVDGASSARERDAIDAHLQACGECRAAVDDLRTLRRDARALPPIEPPEDVWEALAERVSARNVAVVRRSRFHTGLAIAAAVVLGVSLWIAVDPVTQPTSQDTEALAEMVTGELRAAESHYENAITGLEQIIAQNEGALPSELQQTLTANLDLIEETIDESRNAIAANPESSAARESLLQAFRRKVSLLQSTILLINEVRKGEGQNALDLIDSIRESDESSNRM